MGEGGGEAKGNGGGEGGGGRQAVVWAKGGGAGSGGVVGGDGELYSGGGRVWLGLVTVCLVALAAGGRRILALRVGGGCLGRAWGIYWYVLSSSLHYWYDAKYGPEYG